MTPCFAKTLFAGNRCLPCLLNGFAVGIKSILCGSGFFCHFHGILGQFDSILFKRIKTAALADTFGASVILAGMAHEPIPAPQMPAFGGNRLSRAKR